MSYNKFLKDLVKGEQTEAQLSNYYQSKGFKEVSRRGKGVEWDLVLQSPKSNKIKSFEIKTDFYVTEPGMGGMWIEFECRGKDSGIRTTTADKWAHYFYHINQLWVTDVQTIKDLLEEYTFNTSWYSGDKGSNTKGYIVECNEPLIKKHFEIVDVDLKLYNKI